MPAICVPRRPSNASVPSEGVLRQHIIMPDGYVRDTVMFSIVAAEWPDVKARLEQKLTP